MEEETHGGPFCNGNAYAERFGVRDSVNQPDLPGALMAEVAAAKGTARSKGSLLELVVMAVTAVLVIAFSLLIDGFATWGNLRVVVANSASLVILSCGMAVVIISRGLDLSLIASMVAGATTFSLAVNAGWSGGPAFLFAAASMAFVGFVNGWLIAYAEIPAMLVTLASAMLVTGLFRFLILRGEFLLLLPKSNPAIIFLAGNIMPGVPVPVALMVVTLIVSFLLLRYSTAGRTVYAMGDNFQAARLTGLPVRTTTLLVYIYAALTALVAGLVTSAASGAVDFRSVTNGSLLFEVVLVVVLGGIPLRGGRGGIGNTIVGLFVLGVLNNGLDYVKIDSFLKILIRGLILLLALVINVYAERLRSTRTLVP